MGKMKEEFIRQMEQEVLGSKEDNPETWVEYESWYQEQIKKLQDGTDD